MAPRSVRCSLSSFCEGLQKARVVVQRDGTRMHCAEGVEQIGQAEVSICRRAWLNERSRKVHCCSRPVVAVGTERVVVGDQRVHAVDSGELLGQRVERAVVVGGRAGDAAEDVVRAQAAVAAAELLVRACPTSCCAWLCAGPAWPGCPASTRPCGSWPSAPR